MQLVWAVAIGVESCGLVQSVGHKDASYYVLKLTEDKELLDHPKITEPPKNQSVSK